MNLEAPVPCGRSSIFGVATISLALGLLLRSFSWVLFDYFSEIQIETTSTRRPSLIRFTFPASSTGSNYLVVDVARFLVELYPFPKVTVSATTPHLPAMISIPLLFKLERIGQSTPSSPAVFDISLSKSSNMSLPFAFTTSVSPTQASGLVNFNATQVVARFGVSMISSAQACANTQEEVPRTCDWEAVLAALANYTVPPSSQPTLRGGRIRIGNHRSPPSMLCSVHGTFSEPFIPCYLSPHLKNGRKFLAVTLMDGEIQGSYMNVGLIQDRETTLPFLTFAADILKYTNRSMNFVNTSNPNVTSDGFSGFAQRRFQDGTFAFTDPVTCSPVDPIARSCAGRPDLSALRIPNVVFTDFRNDDSGAMF
ncbi:hypothetical protein D9757_011116 [Collybiopsis confluens]|uniref:Uncharacterized protein n=1 Tax=Collybiopsis confluens TaxID=2823264 RepID=A0A8H5GXA7_9AGAR|nr:hypothetical protein D9757_011116 [Collybiopsis confluens]